MVITPIEQAGPIPEGGSRKTSARGTGPPLCLDFTETVIYRSATKEKESLNSFADLATWCNRAGIVTDAELQQRLREAEGRPKDAIQVLDLALALRDTIYRIFSSIAAGTPPGEKDLAALHGAYVQELTKCRFTPVGNGFRWEWARDKDALDRLLWPVVESAVELLTSAELALVRTCASSECSSLFLDTSRNKKRRWCEMKICGNRAKARRHYHRKKQAAT